MRHLGLHHLPREHRREGEVAVPAGRVQLAPDVDLAGLEGLEHGVAVGEVVVADHLEIVQPLRQRQVPAPVVGVAAEADRAPRVHPVHDIGARADRHLHRAAGEVLPRPLRLLEDRPHAHQQRKLAVGGVEGEADRPLAGLLHPGDLGPGAEIAGMALGPERLEGPHHVLDRDRRAVREARLGAQGELDPGAGRVGLDRLAEQAVERERLVQRAQHQRLDHQVRLQRERHHRVALEHPGLERIEAAGFGEANRAALGGLGVGIGQVGKPSRKRGFAIHGKPVGGRGGACPRHRGNTERERRGGCNPWSSRGIVKEIEDSHACPRCPFPPRFVPSRWAGD